MTEEQELLKNAGIVGAQAKNFAPNSVCDKDDFTQTGYIALLKAIRKRDHTKGKLTTYSWPIIYREIKKKQSEKFKNKLVRQYHFELVEPTTFQKINIWEIVPDNMTPQELQIIEMKLDNYSTRQIAKAMEIKFKQVEEIFATACQKIREANLDA